MSPLPKSLTKQKLRHVFSKHWPLLALPPATTLLVGILVSLGLLQPLEWVWLDLFFRLRPLELPDSRITVITIDDSDITKLKTWPIPDRTLAKVLQNLSAQKPRLIGLDLYRDLEVKPGHAQLVEVFQTTPNLLGAEKRFGSQHVPPPPALAQKNQIAMIDLIEDADKTVRRALLSATDEKGQIHLSLGAKAALIYLADRGIKLEAVPGSTTHLKLGQTQFRPFRGNDGGYVRADDNGYQILFNFRGDQSRFQTLSITDVLNNQIPADLVRDRIVLIGSTAASVNDSFVTPYNTQLIKPEGNAHADRMPGVFIHANLISQILSASLEGRPLIYPVSQPLKWLWFMGWLAISSYTIWQFIHFDRFLGRLFPLRTVLAVTFLGGSLVGIHYFLFLQGWWMPTAAPLLGVIFTALVGTSLYSHKLQNLAYRDGLTQVANRRYFEQILAQTGRQKGELSIILCDIDFFKLYNDTYGHQAGDLCLKQVASAIAKAVRSSDLVARYGGEEFVVILPRTGSDNALRVAERMVEQVRSLKISHASSKVSDCVSLSCGVATLKINDRLLQDPAWSPLQLVASADLALYQAKKEGRNRAISFHRSE